MNNDFIKKLLILLYGITIIGLFALCIILLEVPINNWEPIDSNIEYLLSAVSLKLEMLTAWMFGNNNKKK